MLKSGLPSFRHLLTYVVAPLSRLHDHVVTITDMSSQRHVPPTDAAKLVRPEVDRVAAKQRFTRSSVCLYACHGRMPHPTPPIEVCLWGSIAASA